jgi:hypothetical protein
VKKPNTCSIEVISGQVITVGCEITNGIFAKATYFVSKTSLPSSSQTVSAEIAGLKGVIRQILRKIH